MARIAGVELPKNKRIDIALTYIYGLGRSSAVNVCEAASVPGETKTDALSEEQEVRIRSVIEKSFTVEGELRLEKTRSTGRLMDIGCYRGIRHRRGLPVRGQRTHTNARTRKGKKRVAVAGKKQVGK